jgi:hypothetical protein
MEFCFHSPPGASLPRRRFWFSIAIPV